MRKRRALIKFIMLLLGMDDFYISQRKAKEVKPEVKAEPTPLFGETPQIKPAILNTSGGFHND